MATTQVTTTPLMLDDMRVLSYRDNHLQTPW